MGKNFWALFINLFRHLCEHVLDWKGKMKTFVRLLLNEAKILGAKLPLGWCRYLALLPYFVRKVVCSL